MFEGSESVAHEASCEQHVAAPADSPTVGYLLSPRIEARCVHSRGPPLRAGRSW